MQYYKLKKVLYRFNPVDKTLRVKSGYSNVWMLSLQYKTLVELLAAGAVKTQWSN